ncbi:alpha/beta hydrolase family protein [Glacieibacterium megasporae]|uniref:alpha/beta hydrolase family protein n=1 Tax=Glacieibacterium megasporae TaxID=2835787 RepID=UPI001C1E5815|nr:alpha/beta hydrolase [Polymorphobacter megasporae]UAJ12568.1 esterase FrsA [Polymorphobacter megasporae]
MTLLDPRIAPPRTLDELRQETVKRITSGGYPGRGVRPVDAQTAMAALTSLDPEDWAKVWMAVGDRVVDEADRAVPDAQGTLFQSAYAAYTMGRFPTIATPGKQASYEKAISAYMRYAALLPQRLEVVRIPFEGSEIIGYLRKPDGPGQFPLMVQCGGLDFWKENVADEALSYMPHGIGVFAMDMPGTGQSPIKGDVGSERVFSRVFDWAETRPDVDSTRMFMRGVSWGGHWATRVAIAEKGRLLGAINHGGAVHYFFQPEWQLKALGTREYLLDLFGARANVFGVTTLDEFLAYGPRMSLLNDDRIDLPCAPMLVMNGAKDSQVPIADQLLLLQRGDAKEAWINPRGAHMGFGAGWGPDRTIRDIIAPWLLKKLAQHAAEHGHG